MNISELKKYQSQTGLGFVMGGSTNNQCEALQRFKDLVIKEFIAENVHYNNTRQLELPDGLPTPNAKVAIVDKFGKPDLCKFITTSDGDWYWDNMIDCIYQKDEVKEWKQVK